jgi:hypothetical protein
MLGPDTDTVSRKKTSLPTAFLYDNKNSGSGSQSEDATD